MRCSESGGDDKRGASPGPGAEHGPGTEHGLSADRGASTGRGPGAVRGLWAPALANLLIGLVAIVPGLCLRWLLTKYPSVDCGGGIGCDKESPDNALGMITGAVLGCGFVLGMVLVVDILMPRQEGHSVGPWLGMALLIPAPFVVGQALGWV
ncbi:hypothetical protein GCM10011579_050530 [Streptomyces albiflavescens]|uniref:Uncharacterized protein n=1 Tax=Streptomyces albiflavescens TaxID=1623582 RepID=A0A918D6L2_9ACTN|nr:hypothetical protein [Streptomyces albiflavescens]GGN72928.1 hypothetical protein GCM10011579_050530 [Streptomyces albiflavescens]